MDHFWICHVKNKSSKQTIIRANYTNNKKWHNFDFSFPQYVLAVGSSVFSAMFYGDLAEGESEIQIPDVDPAAFLVLLK